MVERRDSGLRIVELVEVVIGQPQPGLRVLAVLGGRLLENRERLVVLPGALVRRSPPRTAA